MDEYLPISFCSAINDGCGCSLGNDQSCSECLVDVMDEIIQFFGYLNEKKRKEIKK